MINLVYRTLETIVNKEQSGYVSPDEFNNIAHLVQEEIFRNYFEDVNRDNLRAKRGISSRGHGNLSYLEEQRIDHFSTDAELKVSSKTDYDEATLPADLYFLTDRGVMAGDGRVVEQVSKDSFGFVRKSISTFAKMYPVYSQFGETLRIYPQGIAKPVTAFYTRMPKKPNWTYRNVQGNPMFDPSNSSFQDFDLHSSEFSNIVLRMLTHFGITIREAEVVQIAEQLKNTLTQKDNA